MFTIIFYINHVSFTNLCRIIHIQRLRKFHLLSPVGPGVSTWDMFFGLIVLYVMFEIPLRIVFLTGSRPIEDGIDSFVTVVFTVDIIINFNLVYDDKENLKVITNRWMIAKRYLTFWFWLDLAATIPYHEIGKQYGQSDNSESSKITKFLRFLRLAKVFKAISRIKSLTTKLGLDPMLVEFVALLLQFFYIAHLFGCFWFYMSTIDVIDPLERSWTNTFGYDLVDRTTQYIASLYWAVYTLLTVGYGDIHATNTGERIYALIVMAIGSLVLGVIIDRVRYYYENNDLLVKRLLLMEHDFNVKLNTEKIPKTLGQRLKVSLFTIL